MRALVVDDEPLARKALTEILSKITDVSSVQVASDGEAALALLMQQDFDVIFLDISMPEMTGIQLLDRLSSSEVTVPAVVFVTAHGGHAISAFEHEAVDFVLKPFSHGRIEKALKKAVNRSQAEKAVRLLHGVTLVKKIGKQKRRIAIKSQGRILFVNVSEISAVQAEGNYVLLQGDGTTHLLRESIGKVEEKLGPYDFVRIHRSVIVNSSHIKEITTGRNGEWSLRLKNGHEYAVSRKYKENLAFVADIGIGTGNFDEEQPSN